MEINLAEATKKIEQLAPEVERIKGEIAKKVVHAFRHDSAVRADARFMAVFESVLSQLADARNLVFAVEPRISSNAIVLPYRSLLRLGDISLNPNSISEDCTLDRVILDLDEKDYSTLIQDFAYRTLRDALTALQAATPSAEEADSPEFGMTHTAQAVFSRLLLETVEKRGAGASVTVLCKSV